MKRCVNCRRKISLSETATYYPEVLCLVCEEEQVEEEARLHEEREEAEVETLVEALQRSEARYS